MQTAESLTDASTGEMEDEMGTGATAPYEPPASAILVNALCNSAKDILMEDSFVQAIEAQSGPTPEVEQHVGGGENTIISTDIQTTSKVLCSRIGPTDGEDMRGLSTQQVNHIATASTNDGSVEVVLADTEGMCSNLADNLQQEPLLTCEETRDAFRVKERLDSNSIIRELRFKPHDSSRLKIPLCRMICLPMVRPVLQTDVARLQSEFVHGYREGDRVMYVSITNDKGLSQRITEEISSSWNAHWIAENAHFEELLHSNQHLSCLSGFMFFVWDGNHRHMAWTSYINNMRMDEREWHISVDSILLETKGFTGVLMNAMNDINRSTENAHVKTNTVHRLHRVNTYGSLKLEDFKELLTEEEYRTCETRGKPYPWYPLTSDVFIRFLYRQEVSAAADEAAGLYEERTPKDERNSRTLRDAMIAAANAKVKFLRSEFDKLSAVGNPKHGTRWLEEINLHWSRHERPDMTLDKLQHLAATIVLPVYKSRWLSWWNSSDMNRAALRFPVPVATEDKLKNWLPKATFWAELEEAATTWFNATVASERIIINFDADDSLDRIGDYIERYRIILWDHAFYMFLGKNSKYSRTIPFIGQEGMEHVMLRCVYRYFLRELVPKGGIAKRAMPKLFGAWIDKTLPTCIFTALQIRVYTIEELAAGPWYLECKRSYAPAEEQSEKATATRTVIEELSEDEADQEVVEPPINKKSKKKQGSKAQPSAKKTRKEKASGATSGRECESVDIDAEVVPVASSQGPPLLQSSSTVVFAPSQWQTASTLRSLTTGVDASRLILQYSIRDAIEYMVNNRQQSPQQIQILDFAKKAGRGRDRPIGGVNKREACFDLIIADVPDGLPVPNVSQSPHVVPSWNIYSPDFVESIFEFASGTLQDNGAVMLFLPDNPKTRRGADKFAKVHGFECILDWWGVNELRLTSYKDINSTTKRFWIVLYIRVSYKGIEVQSAFSIDENQKQSGHGTDLTGEGLLHNFTTINSQLKKDEIPWRGAREKDPLFLQILIESFSKPGDVVLDCNASTGASIHACKRAGRHIVAIESDSAIFEEVLAPLIVPEATSNSVRSKRKYRESSSEEDDDSPISKGAKSPVPVAQNRFGW